MNGAPLRRGAPSRTPYSTTTEEKVSPAMSVNDPGTDVVPDRPKSELLELALLLKLLEGAVEDSVTGNKRALSGVMNPRESQHPEIDGMEAGTVTRNRGRRRVECVDENAFADWLAARHPSELVRRCRASYWKLFRVSGDGSMVVAPDGEVDVPGLIVTVGDPYVSATPVRDRAVVLALWEKHRDRLAELVAGTDGE